MKTQKEIRAKHDRIKEKIHKAVAEMDALRAECTHPNMTRTPNGSDGNWCKADDHYWYDCKCPDCHKIWTEDQ